MAGTTERIFSVPASGVSLAAVLVVPEASKGVVLVIHPTIAARESELGRLATDELALRNLATLRIEPNRQNEQGDELDVHIVADRLVAASYWVVREDAVHGLPLGFFGIERTAGSVLAAAAAISDVVRSVVAAGDEPRLAREVLAKIEAPTLLITPGEDTSSLAHHRRALALLHVEKKLEVLSGVETVISGAGARRTVRLAARWFDRYLGIDERLLGHTSPVRPRA
jgi:putative phosphoribosyl transferase